MVMSKTWHNREVSSSTNYIILSSCKSNLTTPGPQGMFPHCFCSFLVTHQLSCGQTHFATPAQPSHLRCYPYWRCFLWSGRIAEQEMEPKNGTIHQLHPCFSLIWTQWSRPEDFELPYLQTKPYDAFPQLQYPKWFWSSYHGCGS